MLRTYLDDAKRWRLNVWDNRLRIPNVSTIHDHPWSFKSYILAGVLHDHIFMMIDDEDPAVYTHSFHVIKTGEGGGPIEAPQHCRLKRLGRASYGPGACYAHERTTIHETDSLNGTVTLNDRTPPTKEHTARVFWPYGERWVDAEPRIATAAEIESACLVALQRFDCPQPV